MILIPIFMRLYVSYESIRKWRIKANEKNGVGIEQGAEQATEQNGAATELEATKSDQISNQAVDQAFVPSKTDTVIKRLSSSLEIENALLKAEVESLKAQVEKLRKAMSELM